MTDSEILNDIDYIKSLAEEGRNSPLLSGRIGLWWGILLSITLMTHWASLEHIIPLPIDMIGILWMSFGIIGGIGSAIISKSLINKPGISSVNNRVSIILWTGSSILLFIYSLSALASTLTGKVDIIIMDTIAPVAFGLSALAHFVLSKISNNPWQKLSAILAIAFVPITMLLIGTSALLLAAAIGVVFTNIVPNFIGILREPKSID